MIPPFEGPGKGHAYRVFLLPYNEIAPIDNDCQPVAANRHGIHW